jgi:hypothetical protein
METWRAVFILSWEIFNNEKCYDDPMNKLLIAAGVVIVLVGGFLVFNTYIYNAKQAAPIPDYKNIEYQIDGQPTKVNYFGNELRTDLNHDGREDVVFIVTTSPGGSGTFFYVVAALNTGAGYVGSEAYFLGDRIAPQTTELSREPGQSDVVIVNFADRDPNEPMSATPSLGKSVHLKLDLEQNRWIVAKI